jgi:hypothetical protein
MRRAAAAAPRCRRHIRPATVLLAICSLGFACSQALAAESRSATLTDSRPKAEPPEAASPPHAAAAPAPTAPTRAQASAATVEPTEDGGAPRAGSVAPDSAQSGHPEDASAGCGYPAAPASPPRFRPESAT